MTFRPRKMPVQGRAIATWTAILDAAAQLFESEGYEGVTTNEIAIRAGVSIGSLYQYFPNKAAIVTAIAERHLGDAASLLENALAASREQGHGVAETVSGVIRACVALHDSHPGMHRFIYTQAPRTPESLALLEAVESLVTRLLADDFDRLGVGGADAGLRARLFVQGVEAQIHTVVLDPRGSARERIIEEMAALWTAALAH